MAYKKSEYLVAQNLLVVNHPDHDMVLTGGHHEDGTPKHKKVNRTIMPGEIFAISGLDHDPAKALETANSLLNDLPDWCRDISEDDRTIYAAARWATDVEVRIFADQRSTANG